MSTSISLDKIVDGVLAGDVRRVARAATLLESQNPLGRALVANLFSRTGRALIAGITGPPGAGKSTLVSQLIRVLRLKGKRVGVIAVDPSSAFSAGAILGDRIRMQEHHNDPDVFIRSMAARGRLGGIARATLDLTLLLDAAGFDFILVETVGVGQDETDVAALADITVVVLVGGMGDDVQAIKAGIMEIADVFAINKADLAGADKLEQEIRQMQSLGTDLERASAAPVRRIVALEGEGVEDLLETMCEKFNTSRNPVAAAEKWALRLRQIIRDRAVSALEAASLAEHAGRVASKIEDPYVAADALMAEMARQY